MGRLTEKTPRRVLPIYAPPSLQNINSLHLALGQTRLSNSQPGYLYLLGDPVRRRSRKNWPIAHLTKGSRRQFLILFPWHPLGAWSLRSHVGRGVGSFLYHSLSYERSNLGKRLDFFALASQGHQPRFPAELTDRNLGTHLRVRDRRP